MNKEDTKTSEEIEMYEGEILTPYLVEFSKPYEFEGNTYTSVDMTRLDTLTTRDMIAVNRLLNRNGNMEIMPELSMEYACHMAARAAGLPIEFFNGLSPRDAIKIKNQVMGFLFGSD